ncbi:hypothetical protein ACIQU5_22275 [Streptomyces sp. NPDC090306]|uniref:hypothetical protein n=1 Tax=Streptomyces sp. NPDC090306 TaxID=3365961 RepID=UPI003829F151
MLPPRLLWCDPRPVPRFNRQDPVTAIVRDPGFHEPTDEARRTTARTRTGPAGTGRT